MQLKNKGLTLLEIIVSTIILSLIMVALANVFVSGKVWLLHTNARTNAGELGKYFLDPFQMQVRQDTWNASCLGTGSAASCPSQSQTLDRPYTANYTVTTNFNGTTLSKVKADITWIEF